MIDLINKFITKEQLFEADSKILLAVSGGIDSMCLLDILHKLKYNIGVAHLNHKLRSTESDGDEQFVVRQCKEYGIDCYTKQVDIQEIANQQKQNISDVARKERYKYFSELIESHNYTHIATAHHADDDVETFIMRSMDGSGLVGLASIPVKNKMVVRPLLNTSRSEIEEYVNTHKLLYREDSSNDSTKYLRNAIRKNIIPGLTSLKPSSTKGIKQSIDVLKDSSILLSKLIQTEIELRTEKSNDQLIINLSNVETAGKTTFIYYIIKPYGFNRSQAVNISEMKEAGKYLYSNTHQILFDRDKLIISKIADQSSTDYSYVIPKSGTYQIDNSSSFLIEETQTSEFNSDSWEEMIDAEKTKFPLKIRRWREGDSFKPIGMNGQHQTLQDFMTNQKLSRDEKQHIWLLESKSEIIWVIGYRMSESVKVESTSKQFLRLRFTR